MITEKHKVDHNSIEHYAAENRKRLRDQRPPQPAPEPQPRRPPRPVRMSVPFIGEKSKRIRGKPKR